MGLIELTDYFGSGRKEYLDPDLIARIEYVKKGDGSKIYLKNNMETFVQELPPQVIELTKNKQSTLEVLKCLLKEKFVKS
jgi:hypothetical protein